MVDPFDVLHESLVPVNPRSTFAAELRARLERALLDPTGARMTSSTTASVADATYRPAPPALVPYLGVHDARQALDWYAQVFDARRRGEPYVNPDGTIGHAELAIGDAVLYLAEFGPPPPAPDQPSTGPAHQIVVHIPDVDAVVDRAVSGGAELERPVSDQPYGRTGVFTDPYGHRWMVTTPPPTASRSGPGDVSYLTVWVRDAAQADEFYGAVLGPRVRERLTRPTIAFPGLDHPRAPAHVRPATVPVYHVPDLDAALEQVRAHGGRILGVEEHPHGRIADCYDQQDNWFSLAEPPRA
jgi:uncharacterized glyoxalase superfamily protein PhnB